MIEAEFLGHLWKNSDISDNLTSEQPIDEDVRKISCSVMGDTQDEDMSELKSLMYDASESDVDMFEIIAGTDVDLNLIASLADDDDEYQATTSRSSESPDFGDQWPAPTYNRRRKRSLTVFLCDHDYDLAADSDEDESDNEDFRLSPDINCMAYFSDHSYIKQVMNCYQCEFRTKYLDSLKSHLISEHSNVNRTNIQLQFIND